MTPQEESMLNDLIGRIEQTPLTEKDPQAEQLLNQRLGRNPDALYVLAQTVLVQKYALEQAQAQLSQLRQLQATPAQPQKATSFLGNLLGHHDPAPPPPPPPPQPGYGASPYGQPQYQQPWSQGPGYPPGPPMQSGGSSFLRNAATTAAGVAAGALAFQGVESLLHGFGGGGGASGLAGGGFFGGGERPEETIINNYYDEPGSRGDRAADTSFGDPQNDVGNLQTASDDLRDDGNDSNLNDDTSDLDDTSYDDSSSFDDSGSGDDLV
jgi:uncharacterized protein